jgi:N-acetyl-gamma-glutamyl-phosphate reductase
MADCYLTVSESVAMPSTTEVLAILQAAYADEPFVKIYEEGQLPQIEHVAGSNFCYIGAVADERTRTIVVVSVTDNLIKGAAGQAIQNMNIMFGLKETAGLL